MRDRTVKALSTIHTAAFRLTGGRVGRRLVDNEMGILTTVGRVTGKDHAVPLLVLADDDDWVVVASYGGRPDHPEWYRNLVAGPEARLQLGSLIHEVSASTMGDEERDLWWPRIVAAYDGYADYATRTDRPTPVVRLSRPP